MLTLKPQLQNHSIPVMVAACYVAFSVSTLAQVRQTDGPSEKETIEWIQSHASELGSIEARQYGSHFQYSKVDVQGDKLILVRTSEDRRWGTLVCEMERIKINLRKISGAISLGGENNDEIKFTTKDSSVEIERSCYATLNGQSFSLNGKELSGPLESPWDYVKKSIEEGTLEPLSQEPDGIRGSGGAGRAPTGRWQQHKWLIVVPREDATRYKKAFDHLVLLHDGGKPEAF